MIDFKDKTHKEFYESIGMLKEVFYRRLKGKTMWKQEEVLKLADYLDTKASVIRLQIKESGGRIKPSKTTYVYENGKLRKLNEE